MIAIGFVELYHTDKQGNLLGIYKGKNIIFDDARVSILMNPCIVDDLSSYVMYLSEFSDSVTTFYTYWDSSLITSYVTSSFTLTATDDLDYPFTKMFTFSMPAPGVLPGGTDRTLRVVGLRVPGSTICTAITLNAPINHTVSTYIQGIYKLIFGVIKESDLFGNVYNWRNRTWVTMGSWEYKKDFWIPSNSDFNKVTTESIPSLTVRTQNTQSVYNTIAINAALNTPRIFGGKEKDGDPSITLLNNGGVPTKSRTFLHAAGANDIYGNLYAAEPLSEGSIRIDPNDLSTDYASTTKINITKEGSVGVAEYNVSLYPFTLTDLTFYNKLTVNTFYTIEESVLSTNMYFSKNSLWGVVHLTNKAYTDPGYITESNIIGIWYKGLYYYANSYRSLPLTGTSAIYYFSDIPGVQKNGVITDEGILFYNKDALKNILIRYDMESRYEGGYVEENYNFPSNVEIRGIYIDDDTDKAVVTTYDVEELIINGDFSSGVTGWTVETNRTLTNVSGVGRLTVTVSGSQNYGFYQDVTTVVGQIYCVSIIFGNCGPTAYNIDTHWRVDIGSTTSFISPSITLAYQTYVSYYTATTTTTRVKICTMGYAGDYFDFDNISFKHISNGRIHKFDTDDITSITSYDHDHTNFSSLSLDSMMVWSNSERWYWRAGLGKMVWLGVLTSSKILHYWDGSNPVETFTITTVGTVADICVTEDFNKVCFVVQNGTTCNWYVLSLEDGSRWTSLYNWSSTVTGTGTCYVSGNWMFMMSSLNNWGYQVNLVTYVRDSFPSIATGGYTSNEKLLPVPNRSIVTGAVMYNFITWQYGVSYTYMVMDISPINYGWDGTQWIHNYPNSRITHRSLKDLPEYGAIAFGDDYWENPLDLSTELAEDPPDEHEGWDYHSGIIENYVLGEYFSFTVNPNGYVFDNSMTYTATPWVYTGVPYYREEVFFLMWEDILTPSNITITLSKANHPDWMCFEIDPMYLTVEFDTGLKGIQLLPLGTAASSLSYFGEFVTVSASAGTITFYQSCNLHTVTVKYYWIRRDI